MMRTPFWARHRGPYRLVVTRRHPNERKAKAGYSTTAWLPGHLKFGEQVVSEAWALLLDPRDSIEVVSVWDILDKQFVGGIRRTDDRDGDDQ